MKKITTILIFIIFSINFSFARESRSEQKKRIIAKKALKNFPKGFSLQDSPIEICQKYAIKQKGPSRRCGLTSTSSTALPPLENVFNPVTEMYSSIETCNAVAIEQTNARIKARQDDIECLDNGAKNKGIIPNYVRDKNGKRLANCNKTKKLYLRTLSNHKLALGSNLLLRKSFFQKIKEPFTSPKLDVSPDPIEGFNMKLSITGPEHFQKLESSIGENIYHYPSGVKELSLGITKKARELVKGTKQKTSQAGYNPWGQSQYQITKKQIQDAKDLVSPSRSSLKSKSPSITLEQIVKKTANYKARVMFENEVCGSLLTHGSLNRGDKKKNRLAAIGRARLRSFQNSSTEIESEFRNEVQVLYNGVIDNNPLLLQMKSLPQNTDKKNYKIELMKALKEGIARGEDKLIHSHHKKDRQGQGRISVKKKSDKALDGPIPSLRKTLADLELAKKKSDFGIAPHFCGNELFSNFVPDSNLSKRISLFLAKKDEKFLKASCLGLSKLILNQKSKNQRWNKKQKNGKGIKKIVDGYSLNELTEIAKTGGEKALLFTAFIATAPVATLSSLVLLTKYGIENLENHGKTALATQLALNTTSKSNITEISNQNSKNIVGSIGLLIWLGVGHFNLPRSLSGANLPHLTSIENRLVQIFKNSTKGGKESQKILINRINKELSGSTLLGKVIRNTSDLNILSNMKGKELMKFLSSRVNAAFKRAQRRLAFQALQNHHLLPGLNETKKKLSGTPGNFLLNEAKERLKEEKERFKIQRRYLATNGNCNKDAAHVLAEKPSWLKK